MNADLIQLVAAAADLCRKPFRQVYTRTVEAEITGPWGQGRNP